LAAALEWPKQFTRHTSFNRAWNCEQSMKVFNSFVENRVEMRRGQTKKAHSYEA
jgi:hypothetical protein